MKNKIKAILFVTTSLALFSTSSSTQAKEIELNRWKPHSISKASYKTNYLVGEKLDLTGLKINFQRYVKNNNKVEEEIKSVEMNNNTSKNGWLLKYDPIDALGLGNHKIQLRFLLTNPTEQFDVMTSEVVEVDNNNNIISKANT